MRYLLHQTQQGELQSRRQYLFDVSRMYFLPVKPEGSFIQLKPIGAGSPDILFITGHTNYVEEYLKSTSESIPEKTIVITSCMGWLFKKYSARKEIYVPDPKQPLCLLRDGRPYGFEFDVSDAELDLYNASGTILERIHSAYKLL